MFAQAKVQEIVTEVTGSLQPQKKTSLEQKVENSGIAVVHMYCRRRAKTAEGLKPNPDQIKAVKQFKVPNDLLAVQQFLILQEICAKLCMNH